MGAYSPLPWAPEDLVEETYERVLAPMIAEMAARGTPFVGLLYAGLALTKNGIKVIEFNARFGDPETQVLIPRLQTPLATLLYNAATNNLDDTVLNWSEESAVTVVLAAEGYPESPKTGKYLENLSTFGNSTIYFAGIDYDGCYLQATGGRILSVTGLGQNLSEARDNAYATIVGIQCEGTFYRNDIALTASEGK